jgi:hypothetical protein
MCQVGNIIGCTVYNLLGNCTTCLLGSYPSSTGKSCLSFPSFITNNCKTFSIANNNLGCSECRTGYKLVSNSCTILDDYKLGCN